MRLILACVLLLTACSPSAKLPLSNSSADELVRSPLQGFSDLSVKPSPAKRGLRDGVVATMVSPSGRLVTVYVARMDREALGGDFDGAYTGFSEVSRKKVTSASSRRVGPRDVEVGELVDRDIPQMNALVWFRSHRDVGVLIMAANQEEGVQAADALVRAWTLR
jgi:hypothetical protein